MNHAGEIEPLSRLVQPHVAIVTTIAPVHLEYLGSIEAIADAKAEIFRGLVAGGAAVINRDIPQYQRLARAAESGRRARRLVRRARQGRRAADHVVAACRLLDGAGPHPRHRRHLQARRARPPCRDEFAGGAGRGLARGRRPGARGAGARRACAADRPRRAQRARSSRRPRAPDRRELQRQSGLDAGGDRAARAGRRRGAGPPHRRARRHAGARAERRRAASRRWSSRWWRRASTSCSAAAR